MTNQERPSYDTHALRLLRLTQGVWITQAVGTAARLGIADAFDGDGKNLDDIAEATGVPPGPLERLLRTLGGAGLFTTTATGRYALTPMGECLRKEHPCSLHHLAIMQSSSWHWRAVEQLPQVMRDGTSGVRNPDGATGYWHYLASQPEEKDTFDRAMAEFATGLTQPLLLSYDFSGATEIVDVGGGHGALLGATLQANPHLCGILFDLPDTAAEAADRLRAGGLARRSKCIGGDMFEAVPSGSDIYVLSSVLVDWDDAQALRLLSNIRDAMGPSGGLLSIEPFSDNHGAEDGSYHLGQWVDLFELCIGGGRVRTRSDFQSLFSAAGLRIRRILDENGPLSLMEIVPR
ncbi:methyltransferase [Streptomyces albospinus]|uniref:Methyltransferase n=1 Tax=Streptomyces albospinus TaxID=285515 RepID=A0ABQ2VKR1_9ACTN|nr:methyltransferase [Streptomyces albospinus]GGU93902.1 methyltransferase [Streptomyces albospinus]